MPAQLCTEPGCNNIAVGVGYWQGRPGNMNEAPPRPLRCRQDYVRLCGPEFVAVDVVGPTTVACARTGNAVGRGGTAYLDPVATNVVALVAAGAIRLPAPATPAKADGKA
jgi:hypothetical protein